MNSTIISAGQSLVDVAIQEYGTVAALFDLADANGLAITDVLAPGRVLAVPESAAAVPAVVSYYRSRQQRINTDAPEPLPLPKEHDFNALAFNYPDFDTQ